MEQKIKKPTSSPFDVMWDKKTDFKVTTIGILIVGGLVPLVISLIMGLEGMDIVKQVLMVLINTTLLWLGCRRIVMYVCRHYPWQDAPVKHLSVELFLIGTYTFVVTGLFWVFIQVTEFQPPGEIVFWKEYAGTTLVSVIISLMHEAVFIYRQWKENLLRAEKLEKENIASKYETLKNQVNPHFLFNSFNTLFSLIEEDKNTALQYLGSLSSFYRQILQSTEKTVITIEEELAMINVYDDLQKPRIGNGFKLKISIPSTYLNTLIPPLTLQMLVENALKHNTASAKNPLLIDIEITGNEYLTVRNNLQKRSGKQEGTGMGLQNIISRYSLISQKEVMVNNSGFHFTVAVPVIKPEDLTINQS